MSASAWRAANTSPRAVLSRLSPSPLPFLFLFFFFCVKVFFLPPRFWVLHVQYHASQTRHSRKARAQEKLLFFF